MPVWRRVIGQTNESLFTFPQAESAGGLQVWNLTNCKLRSDLRGHTGYINTVTVSPDGSLCASGGKVRLRHPIASSLLIDYTKIVSVLFARPLPSL